MFRSIAWAVSVLAVASVSGCGGGGGGGGGDDAETASTSYEGPIASTDTARGQEVYTNVCMACHTGGPTLENIQWTAAAVRQKVREGGRGMTALPPSRVSDEDLEAVLAFMVTNGGVVADGAEATGADTGGEAPIEGESSEEVVE